MNYFLIGGVIGGSVPILLIAWLIRISARRKWTDMMGAIYSVLIAGLIAFVLSSMGNADGEPMAAYILSFKQLPMTIGSTILALFLVFVWKSMGTSRDTK